MNSDQTFLIQNINCSIIFQLILKLVKKIMYMFLFNECDRQLNMFSFNFYNL